MPISNEAGNLLCNEGGTPTFFHHPHLQNSALSIRLPGLLGLFLLFSEVHQLFV